MSDEHIYFSLEPSPFFADQISRAVEGIALNPNKI